MRSEREIYMSNVDDYSNDFVPAKLLVTNG